MLSFIDTRDTGGTLERLLAYVVSFYETHIFSCKNRSHFVRDRYALCWSVFNRVCKVE